MNDRFSSRKGTLCLLLAGLLATASAGFSQAPSPKASRVQNVWAAEIVSLPLLEAIESSQASGKSLKDTADFRLGKETSDGILLEVIFEEGQAPRMKKNGIGGLKVLSIAEEYDRASIAVTTGEAVLQLAAMPGVKMIRPNYGGQTHAGRVENEAIRALNITAGTARYQINGRPIDGRTQKIGVISDSFAVTTGVRDTDTTPAIGEAGILRGAKNQDSGDLPAEVEILSEGPPADGIDEGAGMAELVYDIAPASRIAFASAFTEGGEADFATGIRRLWQEAGCTVVVDDVIYFAEPMFQDGLIGREARRCVEAGVPYFSAAGNSANLGYRMFYKDSASPDDESPIPTGNDFHVWPNGKTFLNVKILPGDVNTFVIQWNQPFASLPGSAGAQIDLDLYAYGSPNATGVPIYASNTIQGTTGTPSGDALEILQIPNFGMEPINLYLAIDHFSGRQSSIPQDSSTPIEIRFVVMGALPQVEGISSDTNLFGGPTQYGHSMAAGAVSVGAVPWYDTPNYNLLFPPTATIDPEDFTSLGGQLMAYFDDAGNLAKRSTFEPDIAAVDGTNTTFFHGPTLDLNGYQGEPDENPNFFGTSAAAPHAAAVAALLRDMDPSLTPAEITQILQSTAIDVLGRRAGEGFDDTTGAGLINAAAAIEAVARRIGLQPIATPTATPVALSRQAYSFDLDSEGWIFQTVPAAFTEPNGVYTESSISITTTDATNNFGFYVSPTHVVGDWERPGDIPIRGGVGAGTLYRASFSVRSSLPLSSNTLVPTIRMRQGTENFEQSDVLVIESQTTANVAPNRSSAKSYRLYFRMPATSKRFNLYFDVLNFGGENSPDATLYVDRLTLDAIDSSTVTGKQGERYWEFGGNAQGWKAPAKQPLTELPEAGLDSNGLRIGPATQGDDKVYFAYWGSPDDFSVQENVDNAIKLRDGRLYEAIFRVNTSADASSKGQLPAFRLRMNDSTFNCAAYVNIESASSDSNLPTSGSPKFYSLFFEGRPELENSPLIFSFDYLFVPGSGNRTDLTLTLESLSVDSYNLPN